MVYLKADLTELQPNNINAKAVVEMQRRRQKNRSVQQIQWTETEGGTLGFFNFFLDLSVLSLVKIRTQIHLKIGPRLKNPEVSL